MSPDAAMALYEEMQTIMANHRGMPGCGKLLAEAVQKHTGQVIITNDSPRGRHFMIEHLRDLAAAMEDGAVIVSGGLIAENPLHIRGNLQLGEKA